VTGYDPEVEEIDLEDINLHEDPPEEGVRRFNEAGEQDDNSTDEFEEGEALGDDLAEGKHKGEPDA